MKRILTHVALFALTVSLVACSSNSQSTNTGIGAGTGAIVGGLAGSLVGGGTGKAVAVGVGAIGGALLGGYIGHSMDSSDNQRANSSMNNTSSTTWKNSSTGHTYKMTPGKKVIVQGYANCRRYTTTAIINGQNQRVHGTACQQSDGTWVTVR